MEEMAVNNPPATLQLTTDNDPLSHLLPKLGDLSTFEKITQAITKASPNNTRAPSANHPWDFHIDENDPQLYAIMASHPAFPPSQDTQLRKEVVQVCGIQVKYAHPDEVLSESECTASEATDLDSEPEILRRESHKRSVAFEPAEITFPPITDESPVPTRKSILVPDLVPYSGKSHTSKSSHARTDSFVPETPHPSNGRDDFVAVSHQRQRSSMLVSPPPPAPLLQENSPVRDTEPKEGPVMPEPSCPVTDEDHDVVPATPPRITIEEDEDIVLSTPPREANGHDGGAESGRTPRYLILHDYESTVSPASRRESTLSNVNSQSTRRQSINVGVQPEEKELEANPVDLQTERRKSSASFRRQSEQPNTTVLGFEKADDKDRGYHSCHVGGQVFELVVESSNNSNEPGCQGVQCSAAEIDAAIEILFEDPEELPETPKEKVRIDVAVQWTEWYDEGDGIAPDASDKMSSDSQPEQSDIVDARVLLGIPGLLTTQDNGVQTDNALADITNDDTDGTSKSGLEPTCNSVMPEAIAQPMTENSPIVEAEDSFIQVEEGEEENAAPTEDEARLSFRKEVRVVNCEGINDTLGSPILGSAEVPSAEPVQKRMSRRESRASTKASSQIVEKAMDERSSGQEEGSTGGVSSRQQSKRRSSRSREALSRRSKRMSRQRNECESLEIEEGCAIEDVEVEQEGDLMEDVEGCEDEKEEEMNNVRVVDYEDSVDDTCETNVEREGTATEGEEMERTEYEVDNEDNECFEAVDEDDFGTEFEEGAMGALKGTSVENKGMLISPAPLQRATVVISGGLDIEPEDEVGKEVRQVKKEQKMRRRKRKARESVQESRKRQATGNRELQRLGLTTLHVPPISRDEMFGGDGPRRSKRLKFPPLQYWKNEKKRYSRRMSQIMPTVSQVVVLDDLNWGALKGRKTMSSRR